MGLVEQTTGPHLMFQFIDNTGYKKCVSFTQPCHIIVAEVVEEVIPAIRKVQRAVAEGFYAAGYMSYEAAQAFDPVLTTRKRGKMPLVWFGIFDQPWFDRIRNTSGSFQLFDWQPETSLTDYYSCIHKIKQAIQRGETYQVNYTMRLHAKFEGDDFAFYRQLSRMQTSNYSAYLNLGRYRILSASPELFFRWDGTKITTRPMKGTMRRGRWLEEDEGYITSLANSEKNRAENVMIVDLLRNDLGRIAETGSVQVPSLFEIERYPTVLQMTSTIVAHTRPHIELVDIFRALFPGGSITGAPKASSMNIIAELEQSPRGVYCGTIGLVNPGGEAVFNIPIRTVVIDKNEGTAEYGVGGGVTWGSTAEGEYDELCVKALLLNEKHPEFSLLESLKLDHGRYFLLDRHLNRLKQSAEYFGFNISVDRVLEEMEKYSKKRPDAVEKVRVIVSKDGNITIEGEPLKQLGQMLPVALAATPVSKEDRFLFHKKTNRSVYDIQRAAYRNVYDVLLWNEEGEITEFTIGNVVVEINGEKWTPPRHCGLLAGTFRDEIIAQGEIRERVLTKEDLHLCTSIWLINSVQGWVRVRLVEGATNNNRTCF